MTVLASRVTALPCYTELLPVTRCCSEGGLWPPGVEWGRRGQSDTHIHVPDRVSVQTMCLTERQQVRRPCVHNT